ncbi:MAG: cyclic nucleotide-binding domain-containing protein [Agathobacter sp.]
METTTAKMQEYKEDAVIIREGEQQNEMYKIISGKVAVYINYGQKNEYLLGILSEQQCFGEFGILCQKPSLYTVVAVYDVLLMRIGGDEFDDFIQKNSKNASDIIRNLAHEIMNLKLNLDMVMEELANSSAAGSCKVQELRQRMYQNAGIARNSGGLLDLKV